MPDGDRTTVAKAFVRVGVPAKYRLSRQKPQRTEEHEEERERICGQLSRHPVKYFTGENIGGVDLIIDNKKFPIPTTQKTREYLQKQNCRGQIRTPAEGLKKGFTKPDSKKHKINPGGSVNILAGVSGDRVILWKDVGSRWNGAVAAKMYRGPVLKALKKMHPGKRLVRALG